MDWGTRNAADTMIGASELGKMWLIMMRAGLAPMLRAASTYSFSLTESTCPRTSRATVTHVTSARRHEQQHKPIQQVAEPRIPQGGDHDDKEQQVGEGIDDVGEPHQQIVNPASGVPGDHADRSSR